MWSDSSQENTVKCAMWSLNMIEVVGLIALTCQISHIRETALVDTNITATNAIHIGCCLAFKLSRVGTLMLSYVTWPKNEPFVKNIKSEIITCWRPVYADHSLIPQGSTRSSFLVSNESPYFCHYNPKIYASNSLYFESYSRKCTYFQYTNFDFPMYFHNTLIPIIYFDDVY